MPKKSFKKKNLRIQRETQVVDRYTLTEEHLLVKGLDFGGGIGSGFFIKIESVKMKMVTKLTDFFEGKVEEEPAVGFQVDDMLFCEDLPVFVDEDMGSKSFTALTRLWVGEGDPDFRNFIFVEEMVDMIDMGSEECYIRQLVLSG